jgi:hypothetical protein
MGMAIRLVGDEKSKDDGGKGNDNCNEGGGQERRQGRQRNSIGIKGGRQADGDSNKEGNGNKDNGGRQGRGE